MQKLCCVAVSAAALLWASAMPSSAATITWVAQSGTGLSSFQETSVKAGGSVNTSGALTYASDWMEFYIGGTTGGTALVDELGNGFLDEMYEISTSAGGSPITGGGPYLATNTPTFITLSTGVDYFLGLSAAPPLSGFGSSDFSVYVADVAKSPLPGTLVLFAGGLGLLAFAGLRKSGKSSRFSRSFAGA